MIPTRLVRALRPCSMHSYTRRIQHRLFHINNKICNQTQNEAIPMIDYYIFGSCEHGQLGLGQDKQVVLTPKKIDLLHGLDVHKLVIGQNHSVVILQNGAALSWGFNQTGQLGQGHRNTCNEPKPIIGLDGHKVVDAACGPLQTFLITQNLRTRKQAVWHTGMGYWDNRVEEKFTTFTAEPRKVKKRPFLDLKKVKKIVLGGEFGAIITEDDHIYTFGNSGDHGTLGHGQDEGADPSIKLPGPTLVPDLTNIKIIDVVFGWGHMLALTEDHKVYAWGSNQHGQCGVDSGNPSIFQPRLIPYFVNNKIDIVQIASGQTHSMALDNNNNVYIWGSHAEGKLGLEGANRDLLVPTKMEFFDGKEVRFIACGTDHSVVITVSNEIYLWGFGQHGALSVVTEFQNAWTPIKLPSPRFQIGNDLDPNYPNPDNLYNKQQMKEYHFMDDDLKEAVVQGEILSKCFNHKPLEVQCGMDLTVLKMESSPTEEMLKNINENEGEMEEL